jgi:glyoxylase-like metal-dependent hydrolase (beta-lactamase superfamily II)
LSDKPVRFVLNTHWHGDHTGGNENLAKAGVLIVAHDRVRARLSTEQFMEAFNRKVPPLPREALPVITFNDSVTFHLNNEEIRIFHVPPAHTDGDSIVHFPGANVVHMGDTFFNGLYPFIDVSAGGSINGLIDAVEGVMKKIDEETKVIPGHGPLSNKKELSAFRDMLKGVRDKIAPMVDAGKSLQEVIETRPTAEFDEAWGKGFLKPEQFVGIVYESLRRRS